MPSYDIVVTRADAWDDGYEVWARQVAAPTEYGEGVYVGYYPIEPHETEITFTWESPGGDNWKFSATQVRRREQGLTGVST